jgi:hypothetical protein
MTPLKSNQQRLDDHEGERVNDLDFQTAFTGPAASSPIGGRGASAAHDPAVGQYAPDGNEIERQPDLKSRRLDSYLADDPLTRGTMLWLRYAVLLAITLVVLTVVATAI